MTQTTCEPSNRPCLLLRPAAVDSDGTVGSGLPVTSPSDSLW